MSAPTVTRVLVVSPRHLPPDRVLAGTIPLPHVRDVTHHCGLAPEWGPRTRWPCASPGERPTVTGWSCTGSAATAPRSPSTSTPSPRR